jgi:hypothetical protein
MSAWVKDTPVARTRPSGTPAQGRYLPYGNRVNTVRTMRRALLLAAALSIATPFAAAASAHSRPKASAAGNYGAYKKCPRVFRGLKRDKHLLVIDIDVRHLSCRRAYRYIEQFPNRLQLPNYYKAFWCTSRYVPQNSSRTVCVNGREGYRFTSGGA